MSEKSQNVLAVRSRQWIMEALLKLMAEKQFSEITIKEILLTADVSRSTFYRQFKSKEEVLENYYQELAENYTKRYLNTSIKNVYDLSMEYFIYWKEQADFLKLIIKSKCEYTLFNNYLKYMTKAIDLIKIKIPVNDEDEYQYIKHFLTGGFQSIMLKWMNNGFKEPPEHMAKIVDDLLQINIK